MTQLILPIPGMVQLPWLEIAKSYLGLREGPGAADNPEVVALYAKAGFAGVTHDSVPWCAAFVGACLKDSGLPNSNSLAARSYETYGTKLAAPVYGCIGVKKRRTGPEWQGHCGFVVAANPQEIALLGGNTGDAVQVASFLRDEFTAFVWPAGVPLPDPAIPLPAQAGGARNQSEA